MLRLSSEDSVSVPAALDDAAQYIAQAIKRLDEASEVLVARFSSAGASEGQRIGELRRRIDQGLLTVERRRKYLVVVQDHDFSACKF